MRWHPRCERGQALVEVALALPIVLMVTLAGADLARALSVDLALQSAARSAAERGALAADPSTFDAAAAVAEDLAGSPAIDPRAVDVRLATHGGDGVDGSCTQDPPTIDAPCFATVTVRYTVRPLFGWPGVPRRFELDRSRTFRRL